VSKHTSGTTDVLLAACLWGTTGTVRTFIPAATNLSIATIRIVLGGAVLLAVGEGVRRLLAVRRNWVLLGLGAAAMLTYQTAFFSAAARTGVAIGTVVTIGSAPAFAGLLGVVTRQAPLTRRWLVATGGAVAGCVALVTSGAEAGAEPVGIGLALLSGLAYATYTTVMTTLIGRGETAGAVTAALFALAALVAVPALVAGPTSWLLSPRSALIALYLGAVTTAGAYLLFARGLRTTPATTATTLTLAEPAVAALLGVAVLDERLAPAALAGLVLLAASLTLLVLPTRLGVRGEG
jgi:drug/metabolite transporter, DME family